MEDYFSQSATTTLTPKTAIVLGALVTATTLIGVAHGKHTEKTPSQLQSFGIHNALRTSRREDGR